MDMTMIPAHPLTRSHLSTRLLLPLALAVAALGCEAEQGEESQQAQEVSTAERGMQSDTMSARGMGMDMGMGMGVSTVVLGEERIAKLPAERLAWFAYDLSEAGSNLIHSRAPVFLYAADGAHRVTIGDQDRRLQEGEAATVPGGVRYTRTEKEGLWAIVLTTPRGAAPRGLEGARALFESGPLEGVPQPPVQMRLLRVELPAGTQTIVHQHPSPEYIYVIDGMIEYQAGERGQIRLDLGPGDDDAIPAYTPVQKRSPNGEAASFLALFIADPEQEFTQPATF